MGQLTWANAHEVPGTQQFRDLHRWGSMDEYSAIHRPGWEQPLYGRPFDVYGRPYDPLDPLGKYRI